MSVLFRALYTGKTKVLTGGGSSLSMSSGAGQDDDDEVNYDLGDSVALSGKRLGFTQRRTPKTKFTLILSFERFIYPKQN